ncbi:MAG TPA: bifunctional hydroxymethylpyrimidine kinase/phosphomethylpyrimidine kinase [Dissulfurispiraceae bacterium]|nr:bifunctional hydroxymethylpyrimidine kinase/phosphomethylpyrimidine kinase [Dissulfurispiraceae bacterium]
MNIALTIAGSDPTGGAGIQADLKVFRRFAVYGLSAMSAATAQNTFGVRAIERIEGAFLYEQLNTLLSDLRPDALKTGMLLSAEAVRSVAGIVTSFNLPNLVVDPVILSSTGMSLLEKKAVVIMREELFPLAKVITPNIVEASALTGISVSNEETMEQAAIILKRLGPEFVIITGGHLADETLEIIYDGKAVHRLRGRKIAGEFHGTGCAFSAAITALLAKGTSVIDAAGEAKAFVASSIESSLALGKGMKLLDL